jgi:hypothetical protein
MIEINTYTEPSALGAGLNRGLKIGSFLKRNVRLRNVSLQNALKVAEFALPIATSFIPGGAIVGKGASLLIKAGRVGRFASKVARSKIVQKGIKLAKNPAIKSIFNRSRANNNASMPATTTAYGSQEANYDAPLIQQGGQAVDVTPMEQAYVPMPAPSPNNFASNSPVVAPQGELLPVKEVDPSSIVPTMATTSGLNPKPKDNTMLYVGGGIALLGIIYLATKKK